MNIGWICKDGAVIEIPSLAAVIRKEDARYVSTCPELGVASQGKTRKEAYVMLAEAVELWLQAPSAKEIKRRVKLGGSVQPPELGKCSARPRTRCASERRLQPAGQSTFLGSLPAEAGVPRT